MPAVNAQDGWTKTCVRAGAAEGRRSRYAHGVWAVFLLLQASRLSGAARAEDVQAAPEDAPAIARDLEQPATTETVGGAEAAGEPETVGGAETASVESVAAPEPPEYASAIDAAILAHEAADFAQARALLLRAHALLPSARTLRGLGKVEFELGNYDVAAQYLSEALASDVKPLDARLRAEVQALLERARAHRADATKHAAVVPSRQAESSPTLERVHALDSRTETHAPYEPLATAATRRRRILLSVGAVVLGGTAAALAIGLSGGNSARSGALDGGSSSVVLVGP